MNATSRTIYEWAVEAVLSGELPPGAALPREVDLAKRFATTRMNAHWAVRELERAGLVERKRRAGTHVSPAAALETARKTLSRSIHVLYSRSPRRIHWDETSLTALEETVKTAGYSVAYTALPEPGGRRALESVLQDIKARGAAALVVFPDMDDSPSLMAAGDLLENFGVPVFMLNRSGEPIDLDGVSFVSVDPLGEGSYVGRLLRRMGKEELLFLGAADGVYWSERRESGLRRGFSPENPATARVVSFPHGDKPETLAALVDVLARPGRAKTLVAVNNWYAAAALNAAKERGLTAPKDFELMAFDNNPEFLDCDLTTMAHPFREFGVTFGRWIVERSWLDAYPGKVTVKVRSRLIVRNTLPVPERFLTA